MRFESPTTGLLFGLGLTLGAVTAYSVHNVLQIRSLRELQTEMVDRNRRDSLQLLRIQNDLTTLALAMRDMLDSGEPYPLTAWRAQFDRVRSDLDAALRLEEQLAPAQRSPEQRSYLARSFGQFWDGVDRMFGFAAEGNDKRAREEIRVTLQARQAALSTAVARFLVQNNEVEQQAVDRIAEIYDRVESRVYLFLGATLAAIVLTSSYLIWSNRRVFARMTALSEQRSDLAQKLIATQEATLRYISRELHDDFGQVLTAIGSILARVERQATTAGSPMAEQLREAREVAQSTLDKVRGLSQALHPVALEEAGLEKTLDAYVPLVGRQSGIAISYEKEGTANDVDGDVAIHVYRIVQEALNNIVKHSGAEQAWVRLRYAAGELQVEVEDAGSGFDATARHRGIGLVAMRERAELVGGRIEFLRREPQGTLVRLTAPTDRGSE